jgi:hypothetical protein
VRKIGEKRGNMIEKGSKWGKIRNVESKRLKKMENGENKARRCVKTEK